MPFTSRLVLVLVCSSRLAFSSRCEQIKPHPTRLTPLVFSSMFSVAPHTRSALLAYVLFSSLLFSFRFVVRSRFSSRRVSIRSLFCTRTQTHSNSLIPRSFLEHFFDFSLISIPFLLLLISSFKEKQRKCRRCDAFDPFVRSSSEDERAQLNNVQHHPRAELTEIPDWPTFTDMLLEKGEGEERTTRMRRGREEERNRKMVSSSVPLLPPSLSALSQSFPLSLQADGKIILCSP